METGRRPQLIAYLVIIGLNLLVLPTWFSPGRLPLVARLGLLAVSIALVAFCAYRVSGLLGVNPFTRRKRPSYAPYALDDDEDDEGDEEGYSERRRRLRAEARERAQREAQEPRHFGQSGSFREFDPYDEGPDPAEEPRRDAPGPSEG